MKVREIISELTFHGSVCKDQCQGHRAGWYWSKQKNHTSTGNCTGDSDSFKKGCSIGVNQRAQGLNPIGPSIRGGKGRFTKFTPNKNKP